MGTTKLIKLKVIISKKSSTSINFFFVSPFVIGCGISAIFSAASAHMLAFVNICVCVCMCIHKLITRNNETGVYPPI